MLARLLQRVAQGGVHSISALARELGVSEALVVQMADDLVRMEYLKPVNGDCGEQCSACPLADGCAVGGRGGVWTLTDKGMRVTNDK